MAAAGILLVLVAVLGFLAGIAGVLKGNVKRLRITSRKASGLLMLVSLIVFFIGGMIIPSDSTTSPEESRQSTHEQSQVKDKKQDSKQKESSGEKEQVAVEQKATEEKSQPAEKTEPGTDKGVLEVHYVDVGQGGAQVIVTPQKKVMVIDGGNNDDENRMVAYLESLGIKKVDILIGTHPDADHIGGIDAVIDHFQIGAFYMPKIQSNTQTFESVLRAAQRKGLKIISAKAGVNLQLDPAVHLEMISPIDPSNETNEMSAVVRMQYGNHSFLFTGDAGIKSEEKMIASGKMLKSDVLLVGHHGSRHSTSAHFVNAVQPKYAVIQVGAQNNYGHPENEVLARLENAGVKVYRTDKDGTIVFKTTGDTLSVNKSAWTYDGPSKSVSNADKQSSGSSPASSAVSPSTPQTGQGSIGGISAAASIDQPSPHQNEQVMVSVTVKDQTGAPVTGASVQVMVHYKSTDSEYTGSTDSSGTATIPFRIGRAAKGYPVQGDITVEANGKNARTSITFTPQ